LGRAGRWENTVVVLTADHGEHLGEHGLLYHGYFLYDETIHVPLVISGPGVNSTINNELTSLIDVFPTLCDLVGGLPPSNLSGKNILENERSMVFAEYGTRTLSGSNVDSHLSEDARDRYRQGIKCARTIDKKLLLYSNGDTELYAPPDKSQNGGVKKLAHSIEETLGEEFLPAGNNKPVSEKAKSNLQDLGYL
jgi:arylsulfatase A-like enzyme